MRQISGCISTLSAWLGGKQDDLPPESIEQMPRYVMAALVARVNPERPEMLWKKYSAKFAGDVQSKRILYGLQVMA